jgi:FtsP/CotA-like multicopper oxidase with cupredoxin domain
VSDDTGKAGISRRSLITGGLGVAGAGALGAAILQPQLASAGLRDPKPGNVSASLNGLTEGRSLHLVATDGWVSMPTGPGVPERPPFWPDPMAPPGFNTYVFGFRDVTHLHEPDGTVTPANQASIDALKGKAQISAPMLDFDQNTKVRVSLTNLGLKIRPDLVDGHTVHWHGFDNAIPLFDGVPELSVAVPIGRSFTYYYQPRDPGTYMYHCHFEDVEHVQMGMTGVLFVRPIQNGSSISNGGKTFTKFAYNCGDGSTGYDREFAFMLTELWPEAHYRDAHIQVSDWTDFAPSFWLLNGRAYPDTLVDNGTNAPVASGGDLVAPGQHAGLQYQPISSRVDANKGDRVLLRLANLGYQHHTMTLDGLPMTVIAKDAGLLKNGTTDLSYITNTVEIGPGESRDVLFTASDEGTYRLYDRNYSYLNNNGGNAYGGQMTEITVHPANTVGPQLHANENPL